MPLSFAQIVLPASNGTLSELGYDVSSQREAALGLVLSTKKNQSQVYFFNWQIKVWLKNEELVDVLAKAQDGDSLYAKLLPKTTSSDQGIVWQVNKLLVGMKAILLTQIECAKASVLCEQLNIKNVLGDGNTKLWKLAFTVEEWKSNDFEKLDSFFNNKILWRRLYPSGMHKLECFLLVEA